MAEGTLEITIVNQDAAPPVFDGTFITGWHVPSTSDWQSLRVTLDPLGTDGVNVAGDKMRETGVIYWIAENGATNSSLFNGRGAGHRLETTGAFSGIKVNCDFWRSNDAGVNAYYSQLLYTNDTLRVDGIIRNKKRGISIRLIKDDSTDPGTVTDYDGNVYPTVKIGTQVWMAENLRTTHYADGTAIPIVTDDATWIGLATAGMCYYNNTP